MDGDCNRASVVRADSSPKMQSLQVVVYAGDVRDGVEHFEPYGFTSCPADAPSDGRGAEAVVVDLGGCADHPVAIVVGDRRYRLTGLAKGEVAIHDDQGQKVHLTRDGVYVNGKKVDVTGDTTVHGTIDATGKITAPSADFAGQVKAGSAAVSGAVSAASVSAGGASLPGGGNGTFQSADVPPKTVVVSGGVITSIT